MRRRHQRPKHPRRKLSAAERIDREFMAAGTRRQFRDLSRDGRDGHELTGAGTARHERDRKEPV